MVAQDIDTTGHTVHRARGRILAPGFIDMHSHSDFTLPAFPDASNSLTQGVTTEVVGNCGFSPAPLAPSTTGRHAEWRRLGAAIGPDLSWAWTDFGGFLDALDAARPAVNCVPLVGHGAIRTAACGVDDRRPSHDELSEMRDLLAEAASAGAWGLSTGLVYTPSRFAEADEVHTLARDVASWGGIYATHMRDESAHLLEAVDEAIGVARSTGVRVQISHLKAAGPSHHGQVARALEAIDRAVAEGLAVGCDVYPYLAGSTVLAQLLPPWVLVGGVPALLTRLSSDDTRRRIADQLRVDGDCYLNQIGGWKNILIAAVEHPELKRFEGRPISALAAAEGTDEASLLFDILVKDEARTTMILFMMSEDDVNLVLDHPNAVVGSDVLGVTSHTSHVHPRAYGTFARVIRRALDMGESALTDTISRCTGHTAARLGLSDRGLIRPGYVADLVLFDPETMADQATYQAPTRPAAGVEAVYVSGQLAVQNGSVVNPSLGRVLRRPRH